MGARIARFLGKNFLAVIAIVLALGGTAYASFVVSTNSQIGPNTVAGHHPPAGKHANLIGGSVTTADLATNGVTSPKIANGAVSGSKVADGSLTLADLVGADVTATINIPAVASHSCLVESLSVPGAQVGEVSLIGFVGSTPVPGGLMFDALKVSAPDAVTLRICNPTDAASAPGTDVGFRLITLG